MASDEPSHRPLPQIGPKPTPEEFTETLRELWLWSGLTLKQLNLPTSTSSEYLKGRRAPNANWLDSFVVKCLKHGIKHGQLPPDFDVVTELNKWRRARVHANQQWEVAMRAEPALERESSEHVEQQDTKEAESAEDKPGRLSSWLSGVGPAAGSAFMAYVLTRLLKSIRR